MKTNFTAKLFGLTLVTALTLTALTACGNGGAATTASRTASGSALQSGDGGSVGTVLLSVNPEIEMDYDEVGNVVALTGLNEDGKAVLAGGLKNRLGDDLHQVVPAADDGSANPP